MVLFNRILFLICIGILTHLWFCRINSATVINQPRKFLDFFFGSCNCKCGIPNRQTRLFGGEHLQDYEFPWLVIVQIKGIKSVVGTLINDRYVITSASQLMGLTPYDIKITLSQFDRCFADISSLNVSVSSIIVHQEYNPSNRAQDLALLRLGTPIPFKKRVSPICLPTQGTTYIGQVATTAGWSTALSEKEGGLSCRPHKLGLPVLDQNECAGTAFDAQYFSLDKRCIGVIGAKSLICEGDGGGPVMYRSYSGVYELIGILSDKNSCEDKPSTALYTIVNKHLSWITKNTMDACYCKNSKIKHYN